MEYIDGQSLAERLKTGPLEPRQAAQWMAQVADAIGHVHRRGFVHRDLKPQNILLDKEGRLHVADFGLALHASAQQRMAGDRSGTLRYMAPEQVRGEAQWLDGRADVWALGAIFYEMLTGEPPFRRRRPPRSWPARSKPSAPPAAAVRRPSLPAELERICLKCLAKEAGRRYATATDLVGDLRRWLHPRAGRRAIVASLLAVIVLIVAIVAWRLLPSPFGRGAGGEGVSCPRWPARSTFWSGTTTIPPGGDCPSTIPVRCRCGPKTIRVEAQLDQPAYIYLLWIGSDGRVSPLYPWKPGQWTAVGGEGNAGHARQSPGKGRQRLADRGPRGMETLVLLGRREPMPVGLDLLAKLGRLPRQPMLDSSAPSRGSTTGDAVMPRTDGPWSSSVWTQRQITP